MKSLRRLLRLQVQEATNTERQSRAGRRTPLALEPLEDRTLLAAAGSYFPTVLTPNSNPKSIVLGPDGNYWFTEPGAAKIGRLSTDGTALTEFALPTPSSSPQGIAAGPDGNLWFTETNANRVGRITPTGDITEFALPRGQGPQGITAGPDGNLWFTETTSGGIGRITPAGAVTEFSLSTPGSAPDVFVTNAITTGPDGNLWFTEDNANKVGRITPAGAVSEFTLSVNSFNSSRHPRAITAGPDGNLFVAEAQGGVAQVTTAGAIHEFPPSFGIFQGITTGPDGNLWLAGAGVSLGITSISTGGVLGVQYGFGQRPYGITRGAGDRLVFTDLEANKIGVVQQIVAANPSFLQAVYQDALGRPPQAADYAYWVNFSGPNGVSAEPSLIERSSEARTHLVSGWFVQYLGHPANGGQEQFFANQLLAGATEEQVLSGLLGTPEYYQRAPQVPGVGGGSPTDTTFIKALFAQLLNRQPSSSEVNFWLAQVPAQGRPAVALNVLRSAEYRALVVKSYFTTILQRSSPPDAATVQFWVQSGLDFTSIRVAFETSLEFFQHHQIAGLGVTELPPVPTAQSGLNTITNGPDGNFWFTEQTGNNVGRLTSDGKVAEFPVPTPNSGSTGLTAGPDGNLWFTEQQADKVGRITTAGQITEFALPVVGSGPTGITAGPDGNLWFVETTANRVGRITPAGAVAEFNVPTTNSGLNSITAGSDGNLWFTETMGGKIGRITPAGAVTEFPAAVGRPTAIVNGPDGRLYDLESFPDKFGVTFRLDTITTAGATFAYSIPGASNPGNSGLAAVGLTVGPDGNLWITLAANTQGNATQELVVPMTTSGTALATLYVPTPKSGASAITFGAAGTLAFLETIANRVALIANAADANQAYVQALYHDALGRTALGRPAGAPDFNYWLPILAQNGPQPVADGVERSPEARQRVVDGWFVQYLGHAPVNGQDQFFVNQLLAGATEEQVLSGLLGTAEYYQHAPQVPGTGGGSPTDTTFIRALFLQLLNRQPSDQELTNEMGQLATQGRAGVALGLLQLREYRTLAVTAYFHTLLRRPQTLNPADVNFWVDSGLDLTRIRIGMESSTEFYVNG